MYIKGEKADLGFWDFQNPKIQIVNYEIST